MGQALWIIALWFVVNVVGAMVGSLVGLLPSTEFWFAVIFHFSCVATAQWLLLRSLDVATDGWWIPVSALTSLVTVAVRLPSTLAPTPFTDLWGHAVLSGIVSGTCEAFLLRRYLRLNALDSCSWVVASVLGKTLGSIAFTASVQSNFVVRSILFPKSFRRFGHRPTPPNPLRRLHGDRSEIRGVHCLASRRPICR